jgi:hypothetical protein
VGSISWHGGAALATSVDVSSVLRDLVGTVTDIIEALACDPGLMLDSTSPALLRELATRVGVLSHLLEGAVEPPPIGLTLQAVSRRTSIPAATLRTWERRYGFVRPPRSAGGYRRYPQQDLRAILHVKHSREQGVRVSEAMAAVTRER